MRPALLVVAAAGAVAPVVAKPADAIPTTILPPPAVLGSQPVESAQGLPRSSIVSPSTCCTEGHPSLARPNATASRVAEVTGGAIPQQMQASIVGLLGFCIMGLVML
ncbi:hypothetical protein CDD83_2773 [Cordyceps sp. RAO-2017]|nr:hypothetical protein CDD83_2773 [Cordyceps sp. RAO-2017]